jgi:hypothetical protein
MIGHGPFGDDSLVHKLEKKGSEILPRNFSDVPIFEHNKGVRAFSPFVIV